MKVFAALWSAFFLAANFHEPVLARESRLYLNGAFNQRSNIGSPMKVVKEPLAARATTKIAHPAFNPAIHEVIFHPDGNTYFALGHVTQFKNGTAVRHSTKQEAVDFANVHEDVIENLWTFLAETAVGRAIGYSVAGFIGALAISAIIYAAKSGGDANKNSGGSITVGDGGVTVGSGSSRRRGAPPEEHLVGVPQGQCTMQMSDRDDDSPEVAGNLSEQAADELAGVVKDDISNNNLGDVAYRLNSNQGGDAGDLIFSCNDGDVEEENAPSSSLGRRSKSTKKVKADGTDIELEIVHVFEDGFQIGRVDKPIQARIPSRVQALNLANKNDKRYVLGSPVCASISGQAPLGEDCQKLQTYFNGKTDPITVQDGQCSYFAGVNGDDSTGKCWFNVCNVSGCGDVTGASDVLSGILGGIISACVDTMDGEGYTDQTQPSVEYQVSGKIDDSFAVHVGQTGCS